MLILNDHILIKSAQVTAKCSAVGLIGLAEIER